MRQGDKRKLRKIIGIAACVIIAAAVFIPMGIYEAKRQDLKQENDRLLAQYERDLRQVMTEYRDRNHYIDHVNVKTSFYVGSRSGDWACQYCDVKVEPYFKDEFNSLSEVAKCQTVYDCTNEIEDEFYRVRDNSGYMAFRKEHEKGGYLQVGRDHLGYSDWCSIILHGQSQYQYYRCDYYVDGVEWEIERDGDKIKRVVTFQQRKDAERREKEAAEAENRKYQNSSSGSSSSGSGHTSTIDDQDVEAYYYDYRGDFEDEDDAWDDLEDNEDEWDD